MGCTVRLGIASIDDEWGTFTTGLYMVEGSSSDPLHLESNPSTLPVRDVLTSFPILWWSLPGGDATTQRVGDGIAHLQAKLLDATEIIDSPLPLAPTSIQTATFTVMNETLTLSSSTRNLGIFGASGFKISRRLAWFIEQCETVAVIIEASSKKWVATITRDATLPLVLVHPGSFASKSLDALVDHSPNWKAVWVGNTSVYAGGLDTPDHHYRTYEATPDSFDIPQRLTYSGGCLACEEAGSSREHCVPNWIASDHKVVPVTAQIFCVECNNYFGEALEQEIASLARTGKLTHALQSTVFALWAVKTAIALSVASDVRVDPAWMREIRANRLPNGFRIFASTQIHMEPGYAFSIAQFSQSATRKGTFLFSFAVNQLLFVVVRDPSESFELPELAQVSPTSIPRDVAHENLTLSGLQALMMERLTGHAMVHSASTPKLIRSKRS